MQALTSIRYAGNTRIFDTNTQVHPIWGARLFQAPKRRGIDTMTAIEPNNHPKAAAIIPHKTPPSLGRPPHNNQLSIIGDQSYILPSLPLNYDRFMQNKPNFRKYEMNLTSYGHKDYEKMRVQEPRKNKPNLKPTLIPSPVPQMLPSPHP